MSVKLNNALFWDIASEMLDAMPQCAKKPVVLKCYYFYVYFIIIQNIYIPPFI